MPMTSAGAERVALVTGGSRGIGRAIVERLLERGWRVFFCGRTPGSVEAAVAELRERYPGRVAGRAAEVGEPDQVERLVAGVVEAAGRLDLLVNNAGAGVFAPVDEIGLVVWQRLLATNLSGAFYAIRAAAPVMKRQGAGWIVNVASLAARHPMAGGAAYNASKFGLLGLSDAAMLDLRPHGVRVAAVLPGSVDTGFGGRRAGEGSSWRLDPGDVARAVTDLLDYPDRALPSRLELRPSRPPK